jgi:hypothetical protein
VVQAQDAKGFQDAEAAARDDNRTMAPANHPSVDEQAVARPKRGEQLSVFVERCQHGFKVERASKQFRPTIEQMVITRPWRRRGEAQRVEPIDLALRGGLPAERRGGTRRVLGGSVVGTQAKAQAVGGERLEIPIAYTDDNILRVWEV